ncbi:MAG: hypothetical protein HOP29_07925 [Phycisphaerales bacterium]|nr:hypothetical protein [Phycisphaerales bacterium]
MSTRHTLLLFVCAGLFRSASASTVLPMSLTELADAAEQVMEGTVVARESAWSPDRRTIWTTVQFADVRYHKGQPADPDASFELVVPGGQVGDARISVTDAPQFEPGQRWILFLHGRFRVHPVVGLHRGAFQIRQIDGLDCVLDAAGRPIVEFDANGKIQTDDSATPNTPWETDNVDIQLGAISPSVANVSTIPATAATAPMSYSTFIDAIAPILAASRDHSTAQSSNRPSPSSSAAGRPLNVRNRPEQHGTPRDNQGGRQTESSVLPHDE